MRLRYGSFTHPAGTVDVQISQEPLRDEARNAYALRTRWDMTVTVCGTNGGSYSRIDSYLRQLETAYAQDGQNLVWLLPNGRTSLHSLVSADCIGGTKVVVRPGYPQGRGAEFATYRTVRIAVQGDLRISADDLRSNLVSFREQIVTGGGGPRIGYLQTRVGMPVAQLLSRNTVYTAQQSGSVTGLNGWPLYPSPIWPSALTESPRITRSSPRRDGDDYVNFEVSYSYTFASVFPLSGRPNYWR